MKFSSIFPVMGMSVLLTVAVTSCTNHDTNDETTTTSMDTTTVMVPDATTTTTSLDTVAIESDTAKMNTTATTTTTSTQAGAAKPNPAKKGMKGKVAITAPAASNSNAKMEADNTGVYSNVEVIPSFPGGYKGLQKYFDDNLEYPAEATNEGVEGTVNISFVVDENGKLSSPQVIGDKMGYGLETEALRVVNKMPTWTPGKLKGKNVKTRFSLPVKFVLY